MRLIVMKTSSSSGDFVARPAVDKWHFSLVIHSDSSHYVRIGYNFLIYKVAPSVIEGFLCYIRLQSIDLYRYFPAY